jgi:large subunit ribosomal protein L13
MHRQTTLAKPGEIQRDWWVVDAADQRLGRLATRIVTVLRGKHKAAYTPHVDSGDFVVLVNASQVRLTGHKAEQKVYQTYSGHAGGAKRYSYGWLRQHRPERLIRAAVERMMPRNRLARHQLRKLKVYAGPEHPHAAQQPTPLENLSQQPAAAATANAQGNGHG